MQIYGSEKSSGNGKWIVLAFAAIAFLAAVVAGSRAARKVTIEQHKAVPVLKPTRPIAAAEGTAPPAKAPFTEQTWAQAIDLLKLAQLSRDTVSGRWAVDDEELRSDAAEPARIEFPYIPPAEYDFRIEFTQPVAGNVGQVLFANGHQFGWYMGAYVNSRAGFQMIDGKAMPENPTGVKSSLQANHTYVSLVSVRKNGVKAYLDGQLVSQWTTDFRDMSLFPDSKLRGTDVLGVWTAAATTTFHKVEVREVSGPGTSTLQGQHAPADF